MINLHKIWVFFSRFQCYWFGQSVGLNFFFFLFFQKQSRIIYDRLNWTSIDRIWSYRMLFFCSLTKKQFEFLCRCESNSTSPKKELFFLSSSVIEPFDRSFDKLSTKNFTENFDNLSIGYRWIYWFGPYNLLLESIGN